MAYSSYDVMVLGGGPAGAACALSIRQRWPHLDVVIVEASRYDRPRPGEVLAPQAMPLLQQLGIADAGSNLVAQNIVSSWGDPSLAEHHHLFSARGFGLHLDRQAFDRCLAHAAKRGGATLLEGASFHAARRGHGTWTIELRGGLCVRTRFVVDATGRLAVFARSQGARTERIDSLTAYSLTAPLVRASPHTMLIESCALGWWYSAPLPNGQRITSLLTDVDLGRAAGLPSREVWNHHLAQTTHLANLDLPPLETPVHVAPASAASLEHPCGPGWIASGDASATYDPLAGQGMTRALHTGILASYVAAESLLGREAPAQRRYEALLIANLRGYRHMHQLHYQREARWANQPFWQRRQLLVPTRGVAA